MSDLLSIFIVTHKQLIFIWLQDKSGQRERAANQKRLPARLLAMRQQLRKGQKDDERDDGQGDNAV